MLKLKSSEPASIQMKKHAPFENVKQIYQER